jgi:malate synthase
MEDLATDRIYRLMIAQRVRHSNTVEILDDTGLPIRHTPELIHELFDEQLSQLMREGANSGDAPAAATLREAREISEEMIRRAEFNPA